MQIEEIPDNSMCIMDDLETISDEKLLKCVQNFIRQLLELGRHKNIQIVITSHLIIGNDAKYTRTVLNESKTLTVFPQGGSIFNIQHVLETRFGIRGKEFRKLMELAENSRWITLYKDFPQLIVMENRIMFASELNKMVQGY